MLPRVCFSNIRRMSGFSIKNQTIPGQAAYLDVQATTQMDPRVLDAMMPYFTHTYGNPHSRTHEYGWVADQAVEKARSQVASLINADPKSVLFTSGATQSNNMAIKGMARFYHDLKSSPGKRPHLITTQIDHKCVLDSCRAMEHEGFDVTYLPVDSYGRVKLDVLTQAIRPETILVSVIAANNEIGVVQPLMEIGSICRQHKVLFHTDAAQMVGKLPIDVEAMNIDALSLSGHKLYGPNGIGALYVRRRRPRVRLSPIWSGGGQERGLRSGTVPHALCVGLGTACDVAASEMTRDEIHTKHLARILREGIQTRVPDVTLNGHPDERIPSNVNLSFAYVEGESLLMAIKALAVSSGSACTSASLEPSYVLRAIGVGEDLAHTSIRFGLGRFTTEQEVLYAVALCTNHVERLRAMSPLWEMVQDGIDPKTIQWTQDVGGHS